MSTSVGNQAEEAAAMYLSERSHEIIARNWRTRVCEIDIVSKKADCIHFVEVKYRLNSNQGGGLEYITPKKLAQMQFAASCWVEEHKWSGDYVLDAIELSGNFQVQNYIEAII